MKSIALYAATVLALVPPALEGNALRLGTPKWEWLNEPIDLSQDGKMEQVCRMESAGPVFSSSDDRLLVVRAQNRDCFHLSSPTCFLFRVDNDGHAIARLRVSGDGFRLQFETDLRGLIELSRTAAITSEELPPLFPSFAFDSPKLGQSD